jgi:hypothetical protein
MVRPHTLNVRKWWYATNTLPVPVVWVEYFNPGATKLKVLGDIGNGPEQLEVRRLCATAERAMARIRGIRGERDSRAFVAETEVKIRKVAAAMAAPMKQAFNYSKIAKEMFVVEQLPTKME